MTSKQGHKTHLMHVDILTLRRQTWDSEVRFCRTHNPNKPCEEGILNSQCPAHPDPSLLTSRNPLHLFNIPHLTSKQQLFPSPPSNIHPSCSVPSLPFLSPSLAHPFPTDACCVLRPPIIAGSPLNSSINNVTVTTETFIPTVAGGRVGVSSSLVGCVSLLALVLVRWYCFLGREMA